MIGDVLTSTILFEALRKKYPQAELHYLVNSHTVPVLENNPFIDELKLFTPKTEHNKIAFFRFLKQIRKEKYDVVIDVYSKPISVLFAKISGAKTKIGYKKWYSKLVYDHLFTYKSKADTKAGLAIENRMNLLRPLKIDPKPLKPKIFLSETEIFSAKEKLEKHKLGNSKPLFMIGILGSSEMKSYPFEYFAEMLDFIVKKTQADLLVNYMPEQLPSVKNILQLCSENTRKKIHPDLYGKGLRGFLSLLSQCDALIGNEGGAVNMAKALNVPTFSIFSPFIKKGAWALFEDEKNVSVHLNDYFPDVYENNDLKTIKKNPVGFYEKLSPELFLKKLEVFLKRIIP